MTKNKTGFLVLMLLTTSVLSFTSCQQATETKPTAEVEITIPQSITLSNDGSSSSVELILSTDAQWSIATSDPNATWCTITPTVGRGSSKFMVTASSNKDRLAKSVDIIVTAGSSRSKMTIMQKDTLGVKHEGDIIVSNEGETRTIEVQANTAWEVIQLDFRASWIEFTPKHGVGIGSVEFTIAPNPLLTRRETEICFSAGNATRIIKIFQQNIPQATSKTDSLALVALYNAMDGKGWSQPWDLKQPVAVWKGVALAEVEGKTRITSLRLPGRGLDGTVPLEIGNLTCLEVLDLSSNSIKGDLPQEVANLTKLKELNLSTNKFVGAISKNITQLTNLTKLDLQQNRFNLFPAEICQLQKLEYLHLAYNELSSMPGEISQMSGLEFLYLDNNQLTEFPTGLENTPKLQYFHANNNKIKGSLPQAIGQMSSLISLRLDQNELSGEIPANFSNLISLQYLYLGDNKLSGNLPDMSKMTKLSTLSITRNELSGNIPEFGKDGLLVSLKTIELSDNKLKGELTENLRYMTLLEGLYLSSNQIEGVLPVEALGKLDGWIVLYIPKLKAFAIDDNYIKGGLPVGLATRLTQYSPSFNKSQFRVNNNYLTGPVPMEFKGNYGNTPSLFNFAENVYPQRDGVVLEQAN